jgi:hypothetical protein
MTDGDPNEAYEVVPFDRTKLRLERLPLAGTPDRHPRRAHKCLN